MLQPQQQTQSMTNNNKNTNQLSMNDINDFLSWLILHQTQMLFIYDSVVFYLSSINGVEVFKSKFWITILLFYSFLIICVIYTEYRFTYLPLFSIKLAWTIFFCNNLSTNTSQDDKLNHDNMKIFEIIILQSSFI